MSYPYTSKDICRLSGCTHRQLQYWEQKEYIHPDLRGRNVRYYNDEDLQIIINIMKNKKSGKSLGESFILSDHEIKPPTVNQNPLIEHIHQLEKEWFSDQSALIILLEEIHRLEQRIPHYPYAVYNEVDINKLKNLQTKANHLKQKKDLLFNEIKSKYLEMDKPDSGSSAESEAEKSSVPDDSGVHHYSLDQLVLLWIKKHGYSRTDEIRKTLIERLRSGENIDVIVKELR